MRIKIRSDENRFTIWLPNVLLFNPLSALICTRILNRYGSGHVTKWKSFGKPLYPVKGGVYYHDVYRFFKVLAHSADLLDGEPLVDVVSGDGDNVQITL
jgi:hypothetical protein